MRINLRFTSFLTAGLVSISAFSQSGDRFAYAITDVQQEGANWSFLRKLDLKKGTYSEVLLDGTTANQVAYDAISKKVLSQFSNEQNRGYNTQPAFSSGVAAMAYDKKNNRLWYTPMFIDQLRYIDLKTMNVFYVASQDFTGMLRKNPDQGNIITRMVIADDGNGYAMTNDAMHLIRFTTGKNITVTNLGAIVDDPAVKGLSIHSSCTSFGGDMIADNDGNLFVISARNNVFKVNIESKVSSHLGTINGLPANYSVNGAAVTADNKILVSSAVDANGYVFDLNERNATVFTANGGWRASDLANSNILSTRKTNGEAVGERPSINDAELKTIQVYPNPVVNNRFSIQFSELSAGDYTIRVTDVAGRTVYQKAIVVGGQGQVESVKMNGAGAKGFYLVSVIDANKKTVFSKKLIVQ